MRHLNLNSCFANSLRGGLSMKTYRVSLLVVALSLTLGSKPGFAGPDPYDDSQSHPLRIAAYLVYPAAFLTEWLVFRPFHFLVSATEAQEAFFGHHNHPPVLAEPQPFYNYGMPTRVPLAETQMPAKTAAATVTAPAPEHVRIVEVPVEKIVIKEVQVPQIVEVEKVVERLVFPGVAFAFDSANL